MRALLAVLLLLTVAFAGCASKDPGGDEDAEGTSDAGTGSSTRSSTSGGTGSQTGSGSTGGGTGSANRVPTISITLASNQSANGSAPLALTFLLNGTDPDGESISWTLDFADGGENATGASLPAQVNHTFTAEGTYNVSFQATDGKASTNATYPIVVGVASAGGLPPIVVTASWAVGAPEGGTYELQFCEPGPGDGVTAAFFEMPVEAGGRPFTATVTGTPAAAITEWWVFLSKASCGTGAEDYDTFTVEGNGPITGTVLQDWTLGAFAATGGSQLTATITVT